MPRQPTMTVRLDVGSHRSLRDLSRLYTEHWRRHVSVADVVRMGMTLLYEDISDRSGKPDERLSEKRKPL